MGHRLLSVLAAGALLISACGKDKEKPKVSGPFFGSIETEQTIRSSRLRNRVEILWDELGIPHIYATNDADAMFVQGYASAADRFLQMDFIRRLSTGRLSEVLGPLAPAEALASDLEMRRIMMTGNGTMVYDEQFALLDANTQQLLTSYTDGINAWIADAREERNGQSPPANALLSAVGYDLAEWTPADTFAVGRYQQWNLSGSLGDELYNGELRSAIVDHPEGGQDVYRELVRSAPADDTVTLPEWFEGPAFAGLSPLTALGAPAGAGAEIKGEQLGETLRRLRHPGREYGDEWKGSNNWVVGPSLTGGNAMLANDPHLTLLNPPLFYNTHINTKRFGSGSVNAIGVTFPGIPGLLVGHNERVAWGVTTLGYDVLDLYAEEMVGDDAVRFDGENVPVAFSEQTFVFGMGEDATEAVVQVPYVPHHGAVVSGEGALRGNDETLITMKWTGREPTTDFKAFFGLLTAGNMDDFFEAVGYFDVGAQSFVGVDVEGDIGYYGHALVPNRPWNLESVPPDAPMPGTGEYEWDGYLEDERLVQDRNPDRGYIVTANNDIVGTTLDNNPFNDPVYYWYWQDLGFRIGRITELIEEHGAGGALTLEDMEAIQDDTFSLEGERAVPLILGALSATNVTDARLDEALGYLREWNFGTPTGVESPVREDTPSQEEKNQAVGATVFYSLQRVLANRLVQDDMEVYGVQLRGSQHRARFLLYALENTGASESTAHWFDDVSTLVEEAPADLILASLEQAVADLTELLGEDMATWQWGRLHKVVGPDVLSQATGLRSRNETNGPVANDGSQFTVDVSGYGSGPDIGEESFFTGAGAQVRFVAEMEEGAIVSRSVLPGGQSGNADSLYFSDQWDEWVRNERFDYHFYDKDVEEAAERRWVFLPPAR